MLTPDTKVLRLGPGAKSMLITSDTWPWKVWGWGRRSNNREITHKCTIGDKMYNWAFQIGDWGLRNMLELVGIDCNRLDRLE